MSYTLDEFSNNHLVDEGGALRRPTDAENAMIVDGIVRFLSHFGIRDTTVLGRLAAAGRSETSGSVGHASEDAPGLREVTDHVVNPANDTFRILVQDETGHGGAHHRYGIEGIDLSGNASFRKEVDGTGLTILFQNGPIGEHGVNGITQEALLAIVADRLRSFQAGPYACRENGIALERVEEALHWLQQRTLARMRRGVEGTSNR